MAYNQYLWILDYLLKLQETNDMLKDKAELHFIWLLKYFRITHKILYFYFVI